MTGKLDSLNRTVNSPDVTGVNLHAVPRYGVKRVLEAKVIRYLSLENKVLRSR